MPKTQAPPPSATAGESPAAAPAPTSAAADKAAAADEDEEEHHDADDIDPDLPALVPTDFADDITPAALVTNVAIGEPVVCACFQVDAAAIRAAVANGARTVAQIGAMLRAGTHCGSCLPELKRMMIVHEGQASERQADKP